MPVFVLCSKIRFSRGFSKFPGRDRPVSGLQNRVANRVAKQGRKTGQDKVGCGTAPGRRSDTGSAPQPGGRQKRAGTVPNPPRRRTGTHDPTGCPAPQTAKGAAIR